MYNKLFIHNDSSKVVKAVVQTMLFLVKIEKIVLITIDTIICNYHRDTLAAA